MRPYEIIAKKRDGGELTAEEIRFFIDGFTRGTIPDYQAAAWAMAVYLKGMTPRETADLTMAMVDSGDKVDLSSIPGVKVDKHSTGGVGDKTTLILAPLVAAMGIPMAKMSGRGLGHTGGTLDKFEAIPGFSVNLSPQAFLEQVKTIGCAVAGQTGNLTPADKKLYALRDVTATVNSIPLIASSVMSKKIAAGADAIVLDVKTGSGAFMKTLEESVQLAQAMVSIGQRVGRKTVALISDMSRPLGHAVGNSLEVAEALEVLRGQGPDDLREICLVLAARMVLLARPREKEEEVRRRLEELLAGGQAMERFARLIAAQGGDPRVVDDPALLPQASGRLEVVAPEDGYIAGMDGEALGLAAAFLGAGRETKDSAVDLAVGLVVHKKTGDRVAKGEPLVTLHLNDPAKGEEGRRRVLAAYRIGQGPVTPPPLLYGLVTDKGVELWRN